MTAPSDAQCWEPILIYTVAIDTKHFQRLLESFHPNVDADYEGTRYQGAASIVTRMTNVHELITGSRHRLSNFRVLSRIEEVVVTETYVDAFLVGGPIDAPLTYRDIGTYHDEVTMWQGRPVIRRRRYERLWREGDVAALSAY